MSARAAIAVFCGSREGRNPAARQAASELGTGLARAGHALIYGGGRLGLMGVLADAALAAGGTVIGVIPDFLMRAEMAHPALSELVITRSMHERKQHIFARAQAYVALPGGIGTLDETIEAIAWRQLGLHAKPIFLCDAGGWARGFAQALAVACADGFADPPATLVEIVPDVASLLPLLARLPPAEAETAARL